MSWQDVVHGQIVRLSMARDDLDVWNNDERHVTESRPGCVTDLGHLVRLAIESWELDLGWQDIHTKEWRVDKGYDYD